MPEAIGPYKQVALLGKGGMGEVWEALDTRNQRTVALKVLSPEALRDPELQRRFLREMRLAAEIENPYVVAVYDYDVGPPPYIAMRLIRGRNLSTEIKQGRMTLARTVDIVQQIASALQAAHDTGLRHRDVKPSNILLDKGHREGLDHAYLIDWGIAHRIDTSDQDVTRTGQMVGTPAYIAPERLLDNKADHRADIYSLAVVLYEALAGGTLPFGSPGQPFPLRAHLFDPPRDLPDTVPAKLRKVVYKGLAKKPDQRYQSAAEFGEAAWAALNAPTKAVPVQRTERDLTPALWPAGGAVAGAAIGGGLLAGGLLDTSTIWALPALIAAGAGLSWGFKPSRRKPTPPPPGPVDTTRVSGSGGFPGPRP